MNYQVNNKSCGGGGGGEGGRGWGRDVLPPPHHPHPLSLSPVEQPNHKNAEENQGSKGSRSEEAALRSSQRLCSLAAKRDDKSVLKLLDVEAGYDGKEGGRGGGRKEGWEGWGGVGREGRERGTLCDGRRSSLSGRLRD